MRITMVGTGYVGLVSGACLANSGNNVICLDIDETKVQKLRDGISPIYEPGLDDMIKRNTRTHRSLVSTRVTLAWLDKCVYRASNSVHTRGSRGDEKKRP